MLSSFLQAGLADMCHHCVIETVKKDMLNRRSFFAGAFAATATAAAVATAAPQAARATDAPKAEDLTHLLHQQFPTYFGGEQLFIDPKFTFAEHTFNLNEWRVNEHTGTHVDAPLHFSADGKSVGELPVEDLVAPLAIIDIRAKAAENPDAQVTPDDVKAWVAANGDLPQGGVLALLSGWGAHVDTPKFRNLGEDGKTLHFPGFHVETAQYLVENSSLKAVAVDTLSLDYGPSPDFAFHRAWLSTGRYGIEAVANLEKLPTTGATIVVGAPKVKGGTGGPARVFALV